MLYFPGTFWSKACVVDKAQLLATDMAVSVSAVIYLLSSVLIVSHLFHPLFVG